MKQPKHNVTTAKEANTMTTEQKKQADFNFTTSHQVSYADIMEPRAYVKNGQKKGDPKYSGTFIIDPTPKMQTIDGKDVDMSDLARLKRDCIALLNANNKSGKKLKIGRLTEEQEQAGTHIEVQVPWKDGTKEADKMKAKGKDGEAFRGKVLLKGTSKYQPALAAIENKAIIEFTTEEAKAGAKKFFYSGAYLVPSFGLHFYKGDEGKPDGVSLYLNAFLFAKHGPRLGGRSANASETFKSYGSISAEDPTGGAPVEGDDMDDEIPF